MVLYELSNEQKHAVFCFSKLSSQIWQVTTGAKLFAVNRFSGGLF